MNQVSILKSTQSLLCVIKGEEDRTGRGERLWGSTEGESGTSSSWLRARRDTLFEGQPYARHFDKCTNVLFTPTQEG